MANKLQWHVNEHGLSNEVLDNLMKSSHACNLYFGTFPFDSMPSDVCAKKKFVLLVNVGLHFVCIFANKNVVLYVDSLGRPSSLKEVQHFLRLCARPVFFNMKKIQSTSSTHCGLYACLFGLFFCKRENQERVGKMCFEKRNLLKNDQICLKYLKRLLLQ